MARKNHFLAGLILLVSIGAQALEKTTYIPAATYFTTLKSEIDHARQSVTAYMYVFPLRTDRGDAMTFRLAESLSAAAKRGVKVEVTLDEFGGYEGTYAPGRGNNDAAYRYLEAQGVDVSYDASTSVVHAKAVVIDGETVIIGSNNWSEAAFTQNVEACLLVRDKKAAADALRDLARAGRKKRPAEEMPAAHVPAAFLTDPGGLGALVRAGGTRILDVYLWLWKLREKAGENDGGWVTVEFAPLAQALGIADTGANAYRREITMILRKKLLNRYHLIEEARFDRGGDARVRLKEYPDGDELSLPAGYWDWGWDKRFEVGTKGVYLLNRYYSDAFSTRPRWSLSLATLVQRHHMSTHSLSGGTTELRRANLVEVEYGDLTIDGSGPREPNVYTPNPLYDPAALEDRWTALEKMYGRETLKQGRAYAALVYEDSDADLAERLILLERERGHERMEIAAQKIGAKHPSNPRRTAGYFIGIVKSLP